MTNREKTMAATVGLAASAFVLYWVYGQYAGYKKNLDEQIAKKLAAINDAGTKNKEYEARKLRWKRLGAQTLAKDGVRLQNKLRTELDQLVQDCALQESSVTLGRLTNLGKNVARQTEYVRVLSATVRGEGRVEDIIRFLYRLHNEPYVVRVKSLTLSKPVGRNVQRGTLGMILTLETPLLPMTKAPVPFEPAQLAEHERQEVIRTMLASYNDYRKGIVRKKLFDPYEPVNAKATGPNPGPGTPVYTENAPGLQLTWQPFKDAAQQRVYFGQEVLPAEPVATIKGGDRQYKPTLSLDENKTYVWRIDTEYEDDWTQGDTWRFTVTKKPPMVVTTRESTPPPVVYPDAEFVVARMIHSPLTQQVVLEDRRNPAAPVEKRVEIGQPLFDGVLVYVHPKGAVSQKDDELRMHPAGERVSNMQKLVSNDPRFPDVYFEVMKLKTKLAGITEGLHPVPETGG